MLADAIKKIQAAAPYKLVISSPTAGQEFRRVNLTLGDKGYYAEKLTETQAFHERVEAGELFAYLSGLFDMGFRQLHAWDKEGREYALKLSKSGRVLTNSGKTGSAPKLTGNKGHNREKRYIISEGIYVPALKDMGVITSGGAIGAQMHDKFRQINRFLEFIDDVYKDGAPEPVRVVDFGCGKSYLTFLTYYYFTEIRGVKAQILGLDLKDDVIRSCREAAERYGYEGLSFQKGDIAHYKDFEADMLISLHACDTATDHALFNAVKNNVRVILAAPCCQHEIKGQMNPVSLKLFSRYGAVKERAAALLTDAIRANLLTMAGYRTQILEFVDFTHTPKNLLIRAVKGNIPEEKRRQARDEVLAVAEEFGFKPMLLRLLEESGKWFSR